MTQNNSSDNPAANHVSSTATSPDYQVNKLEDDRVFETLQSEKVDSIKDSIADIQDGIRLRKQLSEEVIGKFDKIVVDTENFIIKLHEVDRHSELIRGEQMRLKQKVLDVESRKIEEQVNCWRDVAQLKKELRQHLAECREREGRSAMLDSLLEGTE